MTISSEERELRRKTRGPSRRKAAVDTRFWSKVGKGDEEWHCHEWNGEASNGYGRVHTPLGAEYAHRVAYRLALKTPIEPEVVMHICDNRRCVNPLHLIAGTHASNHADCVRKDRHHRAIPGDVVLAIRGSSLPLSLLAGQYGISKSMAGYIRNRVYRGDVL